MLNTRRTRYDDVVHHRRREQTVIDYTGSTRKQGGKFARIPDEADIVGDHAVVGASSYVPKFDRPDASQCGG